MSFYCIWTWLGIVLYEFILYSHMHISMTFSFLCVGPHVYDAEWKKSELCQGLSGLKCTAWLKVCSSFWQSLVPQPWCPITKEWFLAQGCVAFRFSQTVFYCHCTTNSRLVQCIISQTWYRLKTSNVLGHCPKCPKKLHCPWFTCLWRVSISYNYRPVLIR